MNNVKLTKEEQKLSNAYDRGEFRKMPNQKKMIVQYRQIAQNTLAKRENINIRIQTRDLMRIKSKAIKLGLPYQTLVSSILHQYSNQ